jgi:hypothetical protein
MMFETFLLRIYYLNNLDDVDCKTCLLISMQSRDNDEMLQLKMRYLVYNYECNTLLKCMFAMMMQHEDGGFYA